MRGAAIYVQPKPRLGYPGNGLSQVLTGAEPFGGSPQTCRPDHQHQRVPSPEPRGLGALSDSEDCFPEEHIARQLTHSH